MVILDCQQKAKGNASLLAICCDSSLAFESTKGATQLFQSTDDPAISSSLGFGET
jgi:hypothetical protein